MIDLSAFEGRWVAIKAGRVIADGINAKDVFSKVSSKDGVEFAAVPVSGVNVF